MNIVDSLSTCSAEPGMNQISKAGGSVNDQRGAAPGAGALPCFSETLNSTLQESDDTNAAASPGACVIVKPSASAKGTDDSADETEGSQVDIESSVGAPSQVIPGPQLLALQLSIPAVATGQISPQKSSSADATSPENAAIGNVSPTFAESAVPEIEPQETPPALPPALVQQHGAGDVRSFKAPQTNRPVQLDVSTSKIRLPELSPSEGPLQNSNSSVGTVATAASDGNEGAEQTNVGTSSEHLQAFALNASNSEAVSNADQPGRAKSASAGSQFEDAVPSVESKKDRGALAATDVEHGESAIREPQSTVSNEVPAAPAPAGKRSSRGPQSTTAVANHLTSQTARNDVVPAAELTTNTDSVPVANATQSNTAVAEHAKAPQPEPLASVAQTKLEAGDNSDVAEIDSQAVTRPAAVATDSRKEAVSKSEDRIETDVQGQFIGVDASEAIEALTGSTGTELNIEPNGRTSKGVGKQADHEDFNDDTTDPLDSAHGIPFGLTEKETAVNRAGHVHANPDAKTEVNVGRVVSDAARGISISQRDGHEIHLRLDPPELGVLRIDVSLREGQLTARLETERGSSQRLLNSNLPELREQLARQGVQVDRIEVVQVGERPGAGGAQTNAHSFRQQERQQTPANPFFESRDLGREADQDGAAPTARHAAGRASRTRIRELDIKV